MLIGSIINTIVGELSSHDTCYYWEAEIKSAIECHPYVKIQLYFTILDAIGCTTQLQVKVCIIRLVHICFEKSSSTFWQVRCCAHGTWRSCQKYEKYFFQILWPSQKTQTLQKKSEFLSSYYAFLSFCFKIKTVICKAFQKVHNVKNK